jgi:hypothetical protein
MKAKIELINMMGQTVYAENGSIANGKLQRTISISSLRGHFSQPELRQYQIIVALAAFI